jgi:hypothetical protein
MRIACASLSIAAVPGTQYKIAVGAYKIQQDNGGRKGNVFTWTNRTSPEQSPHALSN